MTSPRAFGKGAAASVIHLELPYPVSANRYWRPVTIAPRGKKPHVTIVPTSEAKAYKTECAWLAKSQGVRSPVAGLVELRIQLVPKNGVCMDLDNALKVVIDALKGIAYVDDSQVRKITAERTAPNGKGGLIVEIDHEPVPQQVPMFHVPPEDASVRAKALSNVKAPRDFVMPSGEKVPF